MPEVIPGFVKLTDVKGEYDTSRKTVERRRDKARERADSRTYRMFRLRAKDGEIFNEPSLEEINRLTKEGRVPEWFVARSWLEKEFGKRPAEGDRPPDRQPVQPSRQDVDTIIAIVTKHFEDRIADYKEQLAAAERREQRLMEAAEKDKQRFANATAQLTQVLALPGITEATKAQQQSPIEGTASDRGGTSTQSAIRSSSDAPAQAADLSSRKRHSSRSWFARLTGRRKSR